jgi:four helix bundle protein
MAEWKRVEEIDAFELAVQLRDEVLRLTRSGPVLQDWDFRTQIRDSARSATRNLSEGFYRYHHREFAHFTNIAKSSLAETKVHRKTEKRKATSRPKTPRGSGSPAERSVLQQAF